MNDQRQVKEGSAEHQYWTDMAELEAIIAYRKPKQGHRTLIVLGLASLAGSLILAAAFLAGWIAALNWTTTLP